MALLKKLKSLLGLGEGESSGERRGDDSVGVTVEHDRSDERESAPEPGTETDNAADTEAGSESPPITSDTESTESTESAEPAEPIEAEAETEDIGTETGTEPEETPPGSTAPDTESGEPEPAETDDVTEEGTNVDGTVDVEPDVDSPEPEPEPESESGSESEPEIGSEPEPEPESEDRAETEPETESESPDEEIQDIKGIGPSYATKLSEAGVDSVDQLADADPADLSDETELSQKRIRGWIERARSR